MIQSPPAEVGMSIEEIETPALIIDLDAFERNLQLMADAVAKTSTRLRHRNVAHLQRFETRNVSPKDSGDPL